MSERMDQRRRAVCPISEKLRTCTVKFSPAGPEFAMTSKTANRLRRDPAKASSAATGQIGARGDPARPHAVAQELRDVFVLHTHVNVEVYFPLPSLQNKREILSVACGI